MCVLPMVRSGSDNTVSVAVLDTAPAPVWMEVIAVVVLFFAPAVTPVTVTVMVQLEAGVSVPPVNTNVLPPLTFNVPPQKALLPLAAVMPAGKLSLNATPVNVAAMLLLVSVKLMVDTSPTAMEAGENAFAMVGTVGATVMVAVLLTLPVPPWVEETVVVVLFLMPAVAPVTVTVMVHDEPAAIVPPVNVNKFDPVMTKLPPQTAVVLLTAINPAGKGSVKATPVKLIALFGLAITIVSVAVPDSAIAEVENDFEIVGGALTTITAVLLGLPVPRLEVSAVVTFGHKPTATPVTVTSILHEAFAAKLPPVKASILPPVTVCVPPHVAVTPLTAVKPVGSASLKASAVTAVPTLVIVKRMVAVPLSATLATKNDFAIEGRPTNNDAVFDATPVNAVGPVALTGPVVLFLIPAVAPVTVMLIMQLDAAAMMPPVMVTVCVGDMPAITCDDPVPQMLAVVPFTAVKPAGKVSTTPTPVIPTVFGLLMVKRMVVVAPVLIAALVNNLTNSGGVNTFNVAVAGMSCVPALVVCTLPVELK